MDEKRLQEIEEKTKDHPCYYLERELIAKINEQKAEIHELKTEIRVMDAMLEHYTTALTQLLKEAHTLWARKKQPHSANPTDPTKEEQNTDDER